MSASRQQQHEWVPRQSARWVGYFVAWFVVLYGVWLLLVDSLAHPEVGFGPIAAVLGALLALYWGRLPAAWRAAGERVASGPIVWLRSVQSGHIGDYVSWIVAGIALFGAACAFALH